MKVGPLLQITGDLVPDAPAWFNRVLGPLNSSILNSWNVMNQNVTIGDNLIGQTASIRINTSATYSAGDFSRQTIRWDFAGKKTPQHVMLTQCSPGTRTAISISDWTYDFATGIVNINYVAGLADNGRYNITLLIL